MINLASNSNGKAAYVALCWGGVWWSNPHPGQLEKNYMNKKIYILIQGEHENNILGVFSTANKALEYIISNNLVEVPDLMTRLGVYIWYLDKGPYVENNWDSGITVMDMNCPKYGKRLVAYPPSTEFHEIVYPDAPVIEYILSDLKKWVSEQKDE